MTRVWVRHGLLGAAVVLGAVGAGGSLRTGDLPGNGDSWGLAVAFIGFALLGWFVGGRRPDLPIGWLLLGGGTIGVAAFLTSWWAFQSLVHDPGSLPGGAVAAWLSVWLSALPWPLVLVAPLVFFPTGRLRSQRWRWFAVVIFAVIGVLLLVAAVLAAPVATRRAVELVESTGNEPAADAAMGLQAIARLIAFAATVIGLVGLAVARRRATGDDKRPYTAALAGAAVVVGMFVIDGLVPVVTGERYALPEAVTALFVLALPASIAVAVVRFQVYELRALVNRSALVAITGLVLIFVYLGVLGVLALAVRERSSLTVPSTLAAGAVVAISAPAAALARRLTRRWFGRASAPSAMATRFAEDVAIEDGPSAKACALADTMRNELRLGSVELVIVGVENARIGVPVGPVTVVDLRYGRRCVGEVRATARPGESLGATDLRTLQDIAGYVSIAVEAIRVGEELRRAQHALEDAQSEERRRVRRDLHDDVGPTLASARLKLAAHRRRLPDDTAVGEVIDQIAEAIRGIRRVVDGLQPSVLEDVGLVSALQILLADIRRSTGMHITFEPSSLPDLPSGTASTAYRIVAEALTNVVRHSGATLCTLRVDHDDAMLHIEIADNGRGFDTSMPTGMGLRSMVDRAGLANGVTTISSAPGSGTTIALELPA
jgi:two-component system, NarL family, sensor kinase